MTSASDIRSPNPSPLSPTPGWRQFWMAPSADRVDIWNSTFMNFAYKAKALSWNRGVPMASRRAQILLGVVYCMSVLPMRLAAVSTQELCLVAFLNILNWMILKLISDYRWLFSMRSSPRRGRDWPYGVCEPWRCQHTQSPKPTKSSFSSTPPQHVNTTFQ